VRTAALRRAAAISDAAGFLVDFLPQFLEKATETLELEIFLLMALGFRIIRRNFNGGEVRFLTGLGVVSLYLGVFEVTCTTQSSCSGYKLSRDILHSLGFLVIIVAANFNIQSLAHQIHDSTVSPEVASIYSRHASYVWFRYVFFAFLLAPTFLTYLKVAIIDWRSNWLYAVCDELVSWFIIASLAGVFRPGFGKPKIFQPHARRWNEEDEELE